MKQKKGVGSDIDNKVGLSYPARDNSLINLDWLIGKEWRVAGSHLINKNTKSPPVHSLVIALQKQP